MHWQRLHVQLARLSDAHPILLMAQAVRRIQATPGFTGKAAEAAAAYHKQRQQAATAVELVRRRYAVPAGQALSWMKRPDVQKVVPTHSMCIDHDLSCQQQSCDAQSCLPVPDQMWHQIASNAACTWSPFWMQVQTLYFAEVHMQPACKHSEQVNYSTHNCESGRLHSHLSKQQIHQSLHSVKD